MTRKVALANTLHLPFMLLGFKGLESVVRLIDESVSCHWLTLPTKPSTLSLFLIAFIGHLLIFWCIGGILVLLSYYNLTTKIQQSKTPRPLDGILLILINSALSILLSFWTLKVLPDSSFDSRSSSCVLHLIIFVVIEEIAFYSIHRLGHHPLIYRFIHKVHHRFRSPSAWHAIYAHPIEHVALNLFPLLMPPVLLRTNFQVFLLWLSMAQISTLVAHCGFIVPGVPTNPMHDLHHSEFCGNFGVLGILDWALGTLQTPYNKKGRVPDHRVE